jgi:hypothetical protein
MSLAAAVVFSLLALPVWVVVAEAIAGLIDLIYRPERSDR